MGDFSHLKAAKKTTVEFTFWGVVGEPKLVVKPAGEPNKPYFNEMLRRAEQLQKSKAKVSVELVQQHRERDRDLFPKYVIIGWVDVKDKDGVAVPYTQADCRAFLDALDDDQFDQLRDFCKDLSNFREVMSGEIVAGNSPTA